MKKGTVLALSLLFLLTLACQGSWCAAERSTRVSAEHRLRPHLQAQELHDKKKNLEVQGPRKLGVGHEGSAVETKHARRMAIGHKGGSMGAAAGGGGAGAGGRNVGGGGAVTRPHNSKNGAVALPVPAKSIVGVVFTCGVALSAFGF